MVGIRGGGGVMQKKESPDFPEVGIPGYVDTQLPLLCAFLPSVALKPTHRHIVFFLCCLCILKRIRVFTKWIRGYVLALSGYADTRIRSDPG